MSNIKARWIPTGSLKVTSKKSPSVAYIGTLSSGHSHVVGYFGKAINPTAYYSFKTREAANKWAANWLRVCDARQARIAESKAERKAAAAQPHSLKVGDVLSGSWGYEQTNCEWWQVTKLCGSSMIEIREIGCEFFETSWMAGKSVPIHGAFTNQAPKRCRVSRDTVRLHSHCQLSRAERINVSGTSVGYAPQYSSSYA